MPSLFEYVREQFPIKLQADKVSNGVRTAPDGSKRNLSENRPVAECERIVAEVVLKPTVGNHRHIRFFGFDQPRVNEFGACLDLAARMLAEARRHVGLHTWPGKTNFEAAFGSRAWHGMSTTRKAGLARGNANAESGFASRSAYVRTKIDQMIADLASESWMIYKSYEAGDAAALKGGRGGYLMAIGPGFPRGALGHFHAGVLVHEVGHNLGLADVCGTCHRLLLDGAHFTPYADANIPQCSSNNTHGPMMAAGGHFIGSKQTTRLAEHHKNATVYNTDSYRWYCYAFFKNEVASGIAEHKRLLPA
ncbi:hypothetical protein [Variovorax paradoxus]|uniref:Uncharacterized protein n=1 Tax=Variovorax paradoxus TaxID=34073 RepID=A0A679JRZ0_VARPD|nr:hypothetical protein VVAX_05341 [Variovorax paradoxus]